MTAYDNFIRSPIGSNADSEAMPSLLPDEFSGGAGDCLPWPLETDDDRRLSNGAAEQEA